MTQRTKRGCQCRGRECRGRGGGVDAAHRPGASTWRAGGGVDTARRLGALTQCAGWGALTRGAAEVALEGAGKSRGNPLRLAFGGEGGGGG